MKKAAGTKVKAKPPGSYSELNYCAALLLQVPFLAPPSVRNSVLIPAFINRPCLYLKTEA